MELKGLPVLVTGAAGFIGANLVRDLTRRGAEVHALIRPGGDPWRIEELRSELTVHEVDVADAGRLEERVGEIRPQAVFNLASERADESPAERRQALRTNVVGTANLLEAVASLDHRRFVHFSSSLEYGGGSGHPLDESSALEPQTFYAATKASATILCRQAAADGQPVVVLRPFVVYGYWQRPARLIPAAVMAALTERELDLTVPGSQRDWVFVEDVVDAALRALVAEEAVGEVINVASGEQWSNEEVVEVVQAVTGRRVVTRLGRYPPRPWDRERRVASTSRAERLLGFEARDDLRRGVEKTVAWLTKYRALYDGRR